MAHVAQEEFCKKIKELFPIYFKNKKVLDCGSLDVNGNNKYLFESCEYTGIDIGEGKNVDVVSMIHRFKGKFDVIISTECFEHDLYYKLSLQNIVRMLKDNGLFLFTCATEGRGEHGTLRKDSWTAPFLAEIPEWQNYYKNLTENDIREVINMEDFKECKFEINGEDLYFWGIKNH